MKKVPFGHATVVLGVLPLVRQYILVDVYQKGQPSTIEPTR